MHRIAVGSIESTAIDAGHLWHAGHDGTRNDAGAVTLDREGRQLPKYPAFLSQYPAVESHSVDVLCEALVPGNRRILHRR